MHKNLLLILAAVMALIVWPAAAKKEQVPKLPTESAPIVSQQPTSEVTVTPAATPTPEPSVAPTAEPTPAPVQTPTPSVQPTATPKPQPPVKAASVPDSQPDLTKLVLLMQPKLSEGTAHRYARAVAASSEEYGFDPLLILAIIEQESEFINYTVSDVGAVGLMQILPSTARGLGVSPSQLTVPEQNIHTGVMYLSVLKGMFGSERLAIIAYNQGEGNVKRGTYRTWYYEGVKRHYADLKNNVTEQ